MTLRLQIYIARKYTVASKYCIFMDETQVYLFFWLSTIIVQKGPCACSDWSKTHVASEHKTRKSVFDCFSPATLRLYHKANEEAQAVYHNVIKHSGHLRTLEKCRKHSPAARVFYISVVFSNARRVLSQCNTRFRLLYLLTTYPS